MPDIWVLEPAASISDAVWQGRPLLKVAVLAESAAFARLAADRWAGSHGYGDALRPGFEDQLLYHAHEAPPNLTAGAFEIGSVLLLDGPIASIGPQNERPPSINDAKREGHEGKTVTTSEPAGDLDAFPGASTQNRANNTRT